MKIYSKLLNNYTHSKDPHLNNSTNYIDKELRKKPKETPQELKSFILKNEKY